MHEAVDHGGGSSPKTSPYRVVSAGPAAFEMSTVAGIVQTGVLGCHHEGNDQVAVLVSELGFAASLSIRSAPSRTDIDQDVDIDESESRFRG